MNRALVLAFALVLPACARSGVGIPLESRVPPGGVPYPANPLEPHLTELRRVTDGGQNAEAYFSPDGQRLIFQAVMPGVSACDQQFTMTLDGQNLRRVSNGDGRTTCGYFFDGGERILYSSTLASGAACPAEPDMSRGYVWGLYDYDIYAADDDGGKPVRIFGSPVYDAEATLSPDGATVVFTSARDGDLEIYTMRPDGSDVRRLTHEVGYDGGPFFSPDGKRIVYRASHPTDPRAVADYQALLEQGMIRPTALDIWIMNADGSGKTRLTDNGKANFAPFFSPSGRRVIFSSNMQDPRGRDFDLYLINDDGTGLERVTVTPEFDGFPMWSPADPTSFVFASNRGGSVEGETNIFLARWLEDVALFAPTVGGGDAAGAACPAFDPDDLAGDIADATGRYLADDALQGRYAGSAGAGCAAELVAYAFRRLGLAPAGDDGTYFQDVPLASAVNPHAPGGTGRNVVAMLPGTDRRLAAEYVVMGAHYDHLGTGGFNSLAPEQHAIHNGADDNASGVAAMIDAAERLAIGPRPRRPVVFIAFTGEEEGLLGSSHWVKQPTVPLDSVVAMLNLDMVGRLKENGLVVYGTGTAAEWEGLVTPELDRLGITRRSFIPDGYGSSDQTPFYMNGVPVLHFFTNTHSDYHRPGDDWEKIDVPGLHAVSELVASLARQVGSGERMAVIPDVGKPEPAAAATSPGYGAYLGSIPDFSPVERGVLLGGVREGSPADLAGLRKGDVIVRLGGMDIADLYGLTDALRAHKPGDTVEIAWLRDGQTMRGTTTLGARP